MTNIIKHSLIKEEEINKKYYFKSLIEIAYQKSVIDLNELNYIQRESIELLKKVVGMLTGNESFTVKYDRARTLLDSAYFTIGVYLKTCQTPDDAIREVLDNKIYILFKKGNELIEQYLNKYKMFYNIIKNNMLKLPNYAYFNTFTKDIDDFFKRYNKDFEATELNTYIEYPLCIGNPDLLGIEFIMEYLTNFNYENSFLQKYNLEDIYSLINRLSNISSELLINLFKQVLITTIAEELSNHSEYHLYVNILEVEEIYRNINTKEQDEIEYIVKSAINKIYAKLEVNDKIKEYIEKCTDNITSSIMMGIKNDNLEIIFGTKREVIG